MVQVESYIAVLGLKKPLSPEVSTVTEAGIGKEPSASQLASLSPGCQEVGSGDRGSPGAASVPPATFPRYCLIDHVLQCGQGFRVYGIVPDRNPIP